MTYWTPPRIGGRGDSDTAVYAARWLSLAVVKSLIMAGRFKERGETIEGIRRRSGARRRPRSRPGSGRPYAGEGCDNPRLAKSAGAT
jgi:hypothetical protein